MSKWNGLSDGAQSASPVPEARSSSREMLLEARSFGQTQVGAALWAGGRARHWDERPRSVTRSRSSPLLFLQCSPTRAQPQPVASAHAETSSRGGRTLGRTAHGLEAGSQASVAERCPGTAGALGAGTSGGRRQETAGMREAAGRAGAVLASLAAGELVLPVGAGGASWDVLAAGEQAVEEDGEGAGLGKGGCASGPGGQTDPAARHFGWRAPSELRNRLSEGEIKPPRKVTCAHSKPGTRSEPMPRAWSRFSPRDGCAPVCRAPHRG